MKAHSLIRKCATRYPACKENRENIFECSRSSSKSGVSRGSRSGIGPASTFCTTSLDGPKNFVPGPTALKFLPTVPSCSTIIAPPTGAGKRREHWCQARNSPCLQLIFKRSGGWHRAVRCKFLPSCIGQHRSINMNGSGRFPGPFPHAQSLRQYEARSKR